MSYHRRHRDGDKINFRIRPKSVPRRRTKRFEEPTCLGNVIGETSRGELPLRGFSVGIRASLVEGEEEERASRPRSVRKDVRESLGGTRQRWKDERHPAFSHRQRGALLLPPSSLLLRALTRCLVINTWIPRAFSLASLSRLALRLPPRPPLCSSAALARPISFPRRRRV